MLGKIVSLLEKLAFFSLLFCFQFPFQFSPLDFVSFSVARGVSLRTTVGIIITCEWVMDRKFFSNANLIIPMIQMQLWCAPMKEKWLDIWKKMTLHSTRNSWTLTPVCLELSQEVRTEYTTLLCWWRKLLSPPNIRFSSNHCFKQFLFIMLYNILEMHKYSLKVSRIH